MPRLVLLIVFAVPDDQKLNICFSRERCDSFGKFPPLSS
jgi:hypothetical protein